ncbi:MAG: hypothetical protein EBU97_04005 [Rhodobacteraceae bacterium]|nr:hypothetical protein [Paracoccaceae bacterium]
MAKADHTTGAGLSRLNTGMVFLLAAVALLSAVPVASNRPALWLSWSAAVAGIAVLYLLASLLVERARPLRVLRYRRLFFFCAVVPAYGLLQSIDLGGVLQSVLYPMRAGLEPWSTGGISVAPDASAMGALRLAGYLIFLGLTIEVCSRREAVTLLFKLLFWGIFLEAAWALFALNSLGDYALWGPKTAYQGMATGTFVNRNALATFLGFGLNIGAALIARGVELPKIRASRPKGRFGRIEFPTVVYACAMFGILAALLATQSRMGIAASVLGLGATVVLFRSARPEGRRWMWVEAAVVLGVLGGVIVVLGQEGVLNRSLFVASDGIERWEIYRHVLGMIGLRPFTGFGLDAFSPAFEAFRTASLTSANYFDYAHNSYLGLWAELGLVVGSIPPVALAVCAARIWSHLRQGENGAAFFVASKTSG